MKLVIATPLGVVVEAAELEHVLAEDLSGLFGIREGHGELVTVLSPSVLSWRGADGLEAHAAVRAGVLHVHKRGAEVVIEVATREALLSDDLAQLESLIETAYRDESIAEELGRGQTSRLHVAVYRGVLRYLRPEGSAPGAAPTLKGEGPA